MLNRSDGKPFLSAFLVRVACLAMVAVAPRAYGVSFEETPEALMDAAGVAPQELSAAIRDFREAWLAYVTSAASGSASQCNEIDVSLTKLVRRTFQARRDLTSVMDELKGIVKWQEMPSPEEPTAVDGDRKANPASLGNFEGAVVFDEATLPAVYYRQAEYRPGRSLVLMQNVVPIRSQGRDALAWRSRGDLYAAVVTETDARLAYVSAWRKGNLSWDEPLTRISHRLFGWCRGERYEDCRDVSEA